MYFSLWVCWYVFSFRTYEDTPAEMLNREDKLWPFENGFINIYWNKLSKVEWKERKGHHQLFLYFYSIDLTLSCGTVFFI